MSLEKIQAFLAGTGLVVLAGHGRAGLVCVGGADLAPARLRAARALREGARAAVCGEDDGAEPGAGGAAQRRLSREGRGAAARLPAAGVRGALHLGRHRSTGVRQPRAWHAERPGDAAHSGKSGTGYEPAGEKHSFRRSGEAMFLFQENRGEISKIGNSWTNSGHNRTKSGGQNRGQTKSGQNRKAAKIGATKIGTIGARLSFHLIIAR